METRFKLRALALDTSRHGGLRLRRTGPWEGVRGVLLTVVVLALVVALLVGWVFAWADNDGGPNALWITLGSIAFTVVLLFLAIAVTKVRASTNLRHAEAAFLTGASHNLRTPLSAIRTAAQTLKGASALSDAEREMLLEAILHETTRLELRVDNLLETARLDLERRPFSLSRIDLGELVRHVLSDARWAFAAAGGKYDVSQVPTGLLVEGDRRALRLLFENLVDNAIKYAREAPSVVVSLTAADGRAVARVADKGVGFPAEVGEELFRRFHRGDTGRPGSGLGLALARAIARGHGGELRLVSPGVDAGTVAEVWLPLAHRDPSSDGVTPSAPQRS